jgi:hypothetical protein
MRRRIARQPKSQGLLLAGLFLATSCGVVRTLPGGGTGLLALAPFAVNAAWAGGKESQHFSREAQDAGEQSQWGRAQPQPSAAFTQSEAKGSEGPQNGSTSQQTQYQGRNQDQGVGQRSSDGSQKSDGHPDRVDRPGSIAGQDHEGPPATVLEMIKRFVNPAPLGHAAQLGSSSSFNATQVLAIGLTPSGLAKARGLGFGVGQSSQLTQLGSRITLLIAPPGTDALSARNLLQSELPADAFGLNYTYRPFRSATGDGANHVPHGGTMRKATFGGCNAARCYGPSIIGWEPRLASCARHIRVGVIDTAIEAGHPAFLGRNIHLESFLANGAAPTGDGHGTGVLALLAGNPNSGTPGLIPDAEFFAANVYHADENGQPAADTVSLLRALDWMRARNVHVINMSMSGPHDELLEKSIAAMSAKGMLFVAAAGNEGPTAPPSYPAAYAPVIAVTAVGRDLRSYGLANHGDYIDLAAPGVGIWTALSGQMEGFQTGTSFAAPHVTAILAAMQGDVRENSKEAFVRSLSFRDLGQAGRDRIYGRGLVLAPSTCGPGQSPGGWLTQVNQVPAMPLPEMSAGLLNRR